MIATVKIPILSYSEAGVELKVFSQRPTLTVSLEPPQLIAHELTLALLPDSANENNDYYNYFYTYNN